MKSSIRNRITIAFIGLAIGPLLLVGGLLVWKSFTDQQEQALVLQRQTARRVATEVGAFIQELESALRVVTQVRGLQGLDREQQNGLLHELQSYRNVFETLSLLDSQGQEQIRLSRLEIVTSTDLVNRSGAEAFVMPKTTGETYYSPIRFEEVTGEPLMTIAVPMVDVRSDLVDGVLIADVRLKKVWELIADVPLREGESVYIVDAQGRVVAHPIPSVVLRNTRFELPDQEGISPGLDGTSVVLAADRISLGEQELIIVAERSVSEALVLVRDTAVFTVVLVVVVLAIAVGWAFVARRQIVQPIERLVATAQAISAGDLSQQVKITSQDEIGVLAQAFNAMTERLRNLIDTLEDRIQERTHALETGADISNQLLAILDLDELLKYVVDRIQTEFKFYHTHIYLIEAGTGDLVMVQGYGQVGQQLKEQGHRLLAGQGIVGTVASTKAYFLSNNVNDLLNFVRNPLLPATNSELAVPLQKGEQVLGVLDIQSEHLNRFTPTDVSLMQSLANQIAIAIDNTRLLTGTQAALKEVERLNRRLMRQAWEEFGEEAKISGYRFAEGAMSAISPDSDVWLPPMKEAATQKQLVKHTHPGNGEESRAELAVPLILRGQVVGVLGVKRDKTPDWAEEETAAVEAVANQVTMALENARLSKEQEKTIEQLKEVDRLKSEFLTSMSHELRTPLNSIIGFADVLLQGIDGELNEMALNDIRLIHNSGQHLLSLINDILDISKIEAGKIELLREPIHVIDAFNDVLAASTSLVKDKAVEIVLDAHADLPPIYADKLRFNQVLLNLVSNAVKFTDEGQVTLKAELQPDIPDKMYISVTDTGIGIPAEKLNDVFDRFRQADSSTTRKYGGTGLGLAITRQLVEMHDGTIGAESKEGGGSTFYFTIPLFEAVAAEDNPATAEAES